MEIDHENLHHAYLLESAPVEGWRFLSGLFDRLNFTSSGNPDYHVFENDPFSVEDARLMRERSQGKAFGNKKIFVISSPTFTLQAQNALLKTLEEPTDNTHFFILLPERDLLLPTLLSRLQVVRLYNNEEKQGSSDAEQFLQMLLPERLAFIKKFIDKGKHLASFLDALLMLLKAKGDMDQAEKVFTLRKYADDPSVMPRLILEHIALILK